MAQLNAYLTFNGNCKEGMEFYKSCLGGELQLMPVGTSPGTEQMPASMHGQIMHAMLSSGQITMMASDNLGGGEYKPGNTVHLCLVCDSKKEIEQAFSKLSKGGKVNSPLKEEFFGWYADVTDKYGFGWMLQFGQGQPK